ncbi:MAG: DNA polymerase I [Candidatus Komeilibacteria bacterium]|nr:DNA polymerase I [Candidatus Komeilibacteria bacterium]
MVKNRQKLIIIDGHALIHRAFHALPPLTTKDGLLVNAVYGFTSILMKIIKEFAPDYIAATFDLAKPTFRHEEFKEYKAHRVKAPDELYAQIDYVMEILEAFKIPVFTEPGFEADDVIGTIVTKVNKSNPEIECIIVTGDLDTLQLVNDSTKIFTMKKGLSDTILYDTAAVKERYGFGPDKVVDFKSLRGDASDNIPGVKGIGEKTACEMIKNFGSLEKIYENLESTDLINDRFKSLLREHEKLARQSYRLATIRTDVPLAFSLPTTEAKGFDLQKVYELFQKFEFRSLLTKIPREFAHGKDKEMAEATEKTYAEIKTENGGSYLLIDSDEDFEKFLPEFSVQSYFAIDTESTGLDPITADMLGISLCWEMGRAYYINTCRHPEWLERLKSILENDKVMKIGHNLKYDYQMLKNSGITLRGLNFDTMLAGYLLFPSSRSLKLDDLVFSELGYRMQPIEDLIGPKGKDQLCLTDVDLEKVRFYAAEDADYTWQLYLKLKTQIEKEEMEKLLANFEIPLITILAEMELTGILIDTPLLKKISADFGKKITDLEKEIYKLSGREFNVGSPKQLKEVLFDELEISTKGLKKTKTGISTAAGELEKMRGLHPVIDLVSQFREYSKLKNTYLDALPSLVKKKTGRVHTSFNQAVTATGRLSSSDPNLQNIPIRTEIGRQIRAAFIARPGYELVAADYSQIELRVIASLSGDKKMIDAFRNGDDIHTATAAAIHNISKEAVTFEQRRQAKEVNFGIIYGLGSTGLAQRTGISRTEAKQFIENYLTVYNSVNDYLEQTRILARNKGYAETLFGRRRYLPEINSGVPFIRAAAERMAINMPVQGTAADLMKLAMIEVWRNLSSISEMSRLLLQVHDELVLEVPLADVTKVKDYLRQTMESIHKLAVPIKVDINSGLNWGILK